MDGTSRQDEESIEEKRQRWLEITGQRQRPRIDFSSLPIVVDPLLPYTAGQIRYRGDGAAAIYMSAETAANPMLAKAVIAHEVAHYQFNKIWLYRKLKNALYAPNIFKFWITPIYVLAFSGIYFALFFKITPQLPLDFVETHENLVWWFTAINVLASIGCSWILLGFIRLPLAMLDSIRSQIEELLADREAIRAGYREGVLLYIESCNSRWWQFLKVHPPRGLRRYFAEKVWKQDTIIATCQP